MGGGGNTNDTSRALFDERTRNTRMTAREGRTRHVTMGAQNTHRRIQRRKRGQRTGEGGGVREKGKEKQKTFSFSLKQ